MRKRKQAAVQLPIRAVQNPPEERRVNHERSQQVSEICGRSGGDQPLPSQPLCISSNGATVRWKSSDAYLMGDDPTSSSTDFVSSNTDAAPDYLKEDFEQLGTLDQGEIINVSLMASPNDVQAVQEQLAAAGYIEHIRSRRHDSRHYAQRSERRHRKFRSSLRNSKRF